MEPQTKARVAESAKRDLTVRISRFVAEIKKRYEPEYQDPFALCFEVMTLLLAKWKGRGRNETSANKRIRLLRRKGLRAAEICALVFGSTYNNAAPERKEFLRRRVRSVWTARRRRRSKPNQAA